MYRIEAISAVKKDMRKLPQAVQDLIRQDHFPAIKVDPRVAEPLHYEFKGLWSYHFSYQSTQYRIVYEIDDEARVVYILMIGPRESFYKRLRQRVH